MQIMNRSMRCILLALISFSQAGCTAAKVVSVSAPCCANTGAYAQHNPLPQRIEWSENGGYCGETALATAGLYYGQYVSQYDVRAALDPTQKNQVLIETDDGGTSPVGAFQVAQSLFMEPVQFVNQLNDYQGFLSWVKSQVVLGYPVAIGVYINYGLFTGEVENYKDEYNHIIMVTGVESKCPLSAAYCADDVLYFWDFGLWTGDAVPAYTSCAFSEFANCRKDADNPDGNLYSLPIGPDHDGDGVYAYGLAITGITDPDLQTTIPLTVTVSIASDCSSCPDLSGKCSEGECPEIGAGSNSRPASPNPTLTVKATNPETGTYNLYLYTTLDKSSKTLVGTLTSQNNYTITYPSAPPIAIFRAVAN